MLEINQRHISIHVSTYAPVSEKDTQRRKGEQPHNMKEKDTVIVQVDSLSVGLSSKARQTLVSASP